MIQVSPARLKSPRMLILKGEICSVLPRADELEECVACGLVPILLGSLEALRLHRENRDSRLEGNLAADGFHVVADETDDAGAVDKGRLGFVVRRSARGGPGPASSRLRR